MALLSRRQLKRQPQGAVQLDRSNPLTQAPGFLWVPTRAKELVQQTTWTKAGSTPPTMAATPSGIATKHTTGAGLISYVELGTPLDGAVDLALGPATYIGVFYANTSAGVAIATRDDGNSLTGWEVGHLSGGAYVGLGFSKTFSSVNIYKSISETASTTGLNVLVVTFDGGILSAGCRIFLNGKEGTYAQQNGSGTTGSDAALNLRVGQMGYSVAHSHDGTILMAGAFRRIWSPAEIVSFSQNPWQIFAPAPRTFTLDVGGTGTTYTMTISGGITFSGTAPEVHGRVYIPSGNISLSGTAVEQHGKVWAPSGSITFSGAPTIAHGRAFSAGGNITFAGTAPISTAATYVITPSGAITFSGTAVEQRGKVYLPSGAIAFSGTVPLIKSNLIVPTGQLVFSGNAPITFNGSTGSTVNTRLTLTFGGKG